MTEIRIVITGDAKSAEKAIDSVNNGLDGLNNRGADGPVKLDKAIQAGTKSTKQMAQEMRNLNYQITDIVVGLSTGQSPFYVLLQQGGQLKDAFGGILPALRAIGSLFTITRVAAGGTAAALALFAKAAYDGTQQLAELDRVQRVSGSGAAKTAGEFFTASEAIAKGTGNSVKNVRELGQALQAMGVTGGSAFNSTLQAMSAYQKATGATSEDTAKLFSGLNDNAAKWAASQNKAFNFVTAAQVEHLKQLQAMGLKQQAADEAAQLFAANMQTKVEPSLTSLGRALQSTSKFFSDFWEAAKDTGRKAVNGETPEERIQNLTAQLARIDEARAKGANPDAGVFRDEARVRSQLRLLQNSVGASRRARDQLADEQQQEQTKIEQNEAGFQSTVAGVQKAGIDKRLQIQLDALAQAQRNTETNYRREIIDETQFQASLLEIELAGLKAREDAVKASQAADNTVTPDTQQGAEAARARNIQYEKQLLEIQAQRQKILDEEAGGQRNQPAQRPDSPLIAQLKSEEKQRQESSDRRFGAAQQAAFDLIDVNEDLSTSLIRGDEKRARAQLEIELRRKKESMDILQLQGEDRQAAEDRFAQYVLLRNQQLNEELKPVWQKQLEDWQDTVALQKKATNDMLSDMLQNAEDAWADFARTGKLSLDRLVQDFIAAQARLAFRQFVAGAGNWVQSLFSTGISLFAGNSTAGITSNTTLPNELRGGRATGGDVQRGGLYRINETGDAETLTVGGRDYLMVGGKSGRVTAAPRGGRAVTINQTIVNNIDSRTDQAQIGQLVAAGVEEGRKRTYDELTAARVI